MCNKKRLVDLWHEQLYAFALLILGLDFRNIQCCCDRSTTVLQNFSTLIKTKWRGLSDITPPCLEVSVSSTALIETCPFLFNSPNVRCLYRLNLWIKSVMYPIYSWRAANKSFFFRWYTSDRLCLAPPLTKHIKISKTSHSWKNKKRDQMVTFSKSPVNPCIETVFWKISDSLLERWDCHLESPHPIHQLLHFPL